MATRDTDRRAPQAERLRIEIQGLVQGVGFRPFVYRLATDLGLAGWVRNDTRGVDAELEGPRAGLERFLERLTREKPALARIDKLAPTWLPAAGLAAFEIRASGHGGEKTALVLPDAATCADCLADIRDPANRRYRYPFTNCTNCGPRFTIVRALPYDRPNTTMSGFAMCAACRAEYEDPRDRRFHAQPNACPACGPQLALWAPDGAVLARRDQALRNAAAALAAGRIVAAKGLGGFHLMVDARDGYAVARLRERKPRLEKPFALMARDLEQARELCVIDEAAASTLASPEAPILLLPRRAGSPVADEVAPGLPTLGVMLASNPLHHLLLAATGFPVVATSGNLTDEPIAIDEHEALARLGGIADLFLVHDRPIERHVDDSVGWQLPAGFALLRRARGLAPLPVHLPRELPCVLAVGGHLKSTIALSVGRRAFLSQHVGDLETPEAMAAFERVIADFLRLYEATPTVLAHDLHPDYVSTQWARRAPGGVLAADLPLVAVQHHHAHLAACLAEHGAPGRALGVIWDGTGFGEDGTVWGGEFLLGDAAACTRVAHLRPFRIPGGEAAVREPRRSALALLWEIFGPAALERDDLPAIASFTHAERRVLGHMLEKGLNAPVTTSAGRLFDGLAALAGLHPRASYEAQAAIAFEFAAAPGEHGAYTMELRGDARGAAAGGPPLVLDWQPLVAATLSDLGAGQPAGVVAARAHAGLIAAIAAVARAVGEPRVALSGGCFQNRRLTEGAAAALAAQGHEVLLHRQVPPNDGGLSLGQLAVAAARFES